MSEVHDGVDEITLEELNDALPKLKLQKLLDRMV